MPQIIHLDETNSTNDYFKTLNKNKIEEGTVIYTKFQTKGRGQQGNSWESEKGMNLLFSMLLYPDMIRIEEQFIISQFISLSIQKVLSIYTDNIKIKWPNDIYWKDRKICGILIENILSEKSIEESIIGIGININQTEFRSNAPNPVSLKNITGKNYGPETLLSLISTRILQYYDDVKQGKAEAIRKEYMYNLYRADGYHWYNDGVNDFEAKIKTIENNGILVLTTKSNTERRFMFKEVKFI